MNFDRWELRTRTALAERGVGYHQATPLIEEARAAQLAGDSLDDPESFAADVAATVDVPEPRARDRFGDALVVVAFLLVPGSLLGAWVAGGLTIPVTVAGLTGVVLAAAALIAVLAVPGALRDSGRPRLANGGFVLGALLVVAAGVAFTGLSRERVGGVSALLLLGVAAVAFSLLTLPSRPAVAGSALSSPSDSAPSSSTAGPLASTPSPSGPLDSAPSPSSPGPLGSSPDPASPTPSADDPADSAAWFARLRGLLVGRFDIPPARAAELADQARAHVEAAGSTPRDEFPPVADYARDLAEAEPTHQVAWWRTATATRLGRLAVPALLLPAVIQDVLEGDWWLAAAGAAVIVGLAWSLVLRRR